VTQNLLSMSDLTSDSTLMMITFGLRLARCDSRGYARRDDGPTALIPTLDAGNDDSNEFTIARSSSLPESYRAGLGRRTSRLHEFRRRIFSPPTVPDGSDCAPRKAPHKLTLRA